MALDLLDSPLRVTWDLGGSSAELNGARAVRIASALSEAGVFFVTLDERPLAHPDIQQILLSLASGGCRTLVVCDGSPAELDALESELVLQTLYLNARDFLGGTEPEFLRLAKALDRVRAKGWEPALWLTPARDTLHLLPCLLDFCREHSVGRFKLPNTTIDGSFCLSAGGELIGPDDLEKLRDQLAQRPPVPIGKVKLEIHDLFLWELLCPEATEARSEYGGCQAGNSLAHISASGDLYPCSSWPEKLGSLLEHSLDELWQSPARLRIRQEIASSPAGCSGCRDYPICFGGCRGLARTFNRKAGGRDPLCRGPR